MFNYQGKQRPSIAQIRAHPWMLADCDLVKVKEDIEIKLRENRE
jgi:hypothetical protein